MPDVLLNSTLPTVAAAFAIGARCRGFSRLGLPLAAMPVLAGRNGKAWCLTLFAFLGNCAFGATAENAAAADTIFINGDVVTMDAQGAVAAAVAVKDGRIAHVGNSEDLLACRSAATEIVDLHGRALLPGFIDSHSHVSMVAAKLAAADLSPKPAGTVVSFADIRAVLRKHIDSNPPDNDDWVVGWGYDHSMLAENRHPTHTDLDRLSTKHPIVLVHFSGHQAVLNSNGLARVGYTGNTPDPDGGVIRRRPGSTEPNGIVEEQAWVPIWTEILNPPLETRLRLTAKALQLYVAEGFTTIQDGGAVDPQAVEIFRTLAAENQLPVDVIAFPFDPFLHQYEGQLAGYRSYRDRFRFGGAKLVLDGGSPGRTAYLREPYFVQMAGEQAYRGYPRYEDQQQVNRLVAKYYRRDLPLNIHALGDAAMDQAITAIQEAERNYPAGDRRTNLIHLQVLREDQLDALAGSRRTLSELEQEQGRPRTRISAMGLPPTPEYIEKLLEHDVERMILTIGADDEPAVIDQLEHIRDAVSAYC